MKRPTNFEKINHKHFVEDAIEYEISLGVAGLWIVPTDKFKDQFENVILLDMMWDYPQQRSRPVGVKFCTIGRGDKVVMTSSATINHADLQTMDTFIDWCNMLVTMYQKQIKKSN